MRRRWLLTLPVCASLIAARPAPAQDEARALLERAIKAQGGADKLSKLRTSRTRSRGKIELAGGIEFTQELTVQMPDKLREVTESDVNGMQVKTVTVVNGARAALQVNGKKEVLDDRLKTALREAFEFVQVARLVPLRDRAYTLSPLGEVQVNDRPAVGLRVSRKGMRDTNLYFDKETGLLAKVERRTVDLLSGKEVTEERILTEYKKVNGLPVPGRVTVQHDGRPFLTVEVLEVAHPEAIDDSEFAVPD
jgi:hypothetical protein